MTVELHDVMALGDASGARQTMTIESSSDAASSRIDASGLLVAPGFVDIQVNGGYGIDLAVEPERVAELASLLCQHGVTAWLPTLVSSSADARSRFLDAIGAAVAGDQTGQARILGAHLEGPAIVPEKRGAHRAMHLISPDVFAAEHRTDARFDVVRMVTLAPELAGADVFIEQLVAAGIVVALGHSAATADEARAAGELGATYATHLFNAMGSLHHREPGLPGSVLVDDRFTVGMIVDGIHVHPDVVRLAWRALGPDRMSLVSDATAALGSGESGESSLGDTTITVGDAVRTPDGTLAGTNLPLDRAVRNLMRIVDCSLADAVTTVTAVPRRLLGLPAAGPTGDAVLLTESGDVAATIIDGQIAWRP